MMDTPITIILEFFDGSAFIPLMIVVLFIFKYNVEIRSKVHDFIHRDRTPYTAHLEYEATSRQHNAPRLAPTNPHRPALVAPPQTRTTPPTHRMEIQQEPHALLKALDDIEDHFSKLTLAERHSGLLGLSFDHVNELRHIICGYNAAVFGLANATGDEPLESCALMVDFERLEQPYNDQIRHYLQTIEERLQNARQHLSDCQAS